MSDHDPDRLGRVAVSIRDVSKRFGPTQACRDVSLDIRAGEIHGILGQNGAGKSTLMKILYGLHAPDEGTIAIHGEPMEIRSPREAMALGIGMVHQHLSVIRELTVWENVALGEPGRLRSSEVIAETTELSDRYGLYVDPHARVGSLTAGQQQRVEILKCLWRNPTIIILDEPTSILSPLESRQLFEILRRISITEGRAIALISHKLDELLEVTDRITVMRDGRVVVTMDTGDATPARLAREMVAEDDIAQRLLSLIRDPKVAEAPGAGTDGDQRARLLELRDATASASDGRRLLEGCSLTVRAGEIVGVAGVEGNGQAPLEYVLSSLLDLDAGEVLVHGRPVDPAVPGSMRRAGVGVIAGDRHASGSAVGMTLSENIIIHEGLRRGVTRRGFLQRSGVRRLTRLLIDRHRIKASSPAAPFWTLSGGNQQRAVVARELYDHPDVLVAAQPTRGLDVAAAEEMRDYLVKVAGHGAGVLLISTDLDEIISLSDRVLVMSRGRIIGELPRHEIDHERLGLLLGGFDDKAGESKVADTV